MRELLRKPHPLSRYSLLSLVALLLGLWRESVVSSHFGLSSELDVYVAASALFLFFGVQISNTLEMVFISKEAKRGDPGKAVPQLLQAAKVLLAINLLVCGALWVGAQSLIGAFFVGFSPSQITQGGEILRALLSAIVIANFCGILKASLNVLGVFAPGLLSGSLVSVFSGGMVLFFAQSMAIDALVYGLILGHSVVLGMLIAAYIRTVGWRTLVASLKLPAVSEKLWLGAAVVLVGEIFYQGFVISERGFASTFPAGTISAFYYAWALYSVPVTLVVVPANTILYPPLAKAFAEGKATGLAMLRQTLPGMLLFGLVPVVVTTVWSKEIVELVLLRGRFNAENVQLTASILAILIYSLPIVAVGRLLRYSLYSMGKYGAATAAQSATLVCILLLGPALIAHHGVNGLAVASTIAVSSQTLVMFLMLWIHTR